MVDGMAMMRALEIIEFQAEVFFPWGVLVAGRCR